MQQVLDGVRPAEDEIVLAKTSSSVFGSTNIAYLLRNMGVQVCEHTHPKE